jgi:hypothetical protein
VIGQLGGCELISQEYSAAESDDWWPDSGGLHSNTTAAKEWEWTSRCHIEIARSRPTMPSPIRWGSMHKHCRRSCCRKSREVTGTLRGLSSYLLEYCKKVQNVPKLQGTASLAMIRGALEPFCPCFGSPKRSRQEGEEILCRAYVHGFTLPLTQYGDSSQAIVDD